jgi:hypothetical protein
VTLTAFHCALPSGEPAPLQASQLNWASIDQLGYFPMGKIDRMIARHLQEKS